MSHQVPSRSEQFAPRMDISKENGLQNSLSSDDMMDADTPGLGNGVDEDVPAERKSDEPTNVEHHSVEDGDVPLESHPNGNTETVVLEDDGNSIAPVSNLNEESKMDE